MHTIRKNAYIYRGSSNESTFARRGNRPTFLRNLPVYFAENKNRANVYGRVIKYQLTDDVHLLNMSDPKTVIYLLNSTTSNVVKKAIAKAFRLSNNKLNVRRFSRIKYDMYVAELICRLGYDGYYAPELKNAKTTEGKFPAEIVLCKPKKVLRVVNVYSPTLPPTTRRGVTENLSRSVRNTVYF